MESKVIINREKSKEFSIGALISGVARINQKFIQNYFKNYSGYQHDNYDIERTYSSFWEKLFSEPEEMQKVQNFYLEFLEKQQALWKNVFVDHYLNKGIVEPFISPKKGDNRFRAPQWSKSDYFDFLKQSHLLTEQLALRIVDEVEIGEPIRHRLDFYTKQYINLLSPANFLFTNPEALELAAETKGKSLWYGFDNFVRDVEGGGITQVDKSAFEVGKNLATTPGAVIFENELMQLIQYTPSTKSVFEVPLLIIPPCINKYYILDLHPENSFVKYSVDQGFTVFIVSWKNPSPEISDLTFDDYVNKGPLTAIDIVKEVSGASKINVLGYCVGGTLLSVAAAILAVRKKNVINTLTFLASMVDFSDIGPMGDVINKSLVKKFERGELLSEGLMHGHDMERAFNLIRAKDLVWVYAVNNYLEGMPPQVSEVMYWTNDNTNLHANMYIYYIKQMVYENNLSRKNVLTICDTLIDIGKIDVPVFVIAMQTDYISPPATVFVTTKLVSGPVEFILGESGHVMGIANPPSKKKYGHYLNGKLGKGYDEWQKTAKFHEGSWWTSWSEKLEAKSGKQTPSPKSPGNKKYKRIEPAPGRYVKEKC